MALDDLEDAALMLQGLVPFDRGGDGRSARSVGLASPGPVSHRGVAVSALPSLAIGTFRAVLVLQVALSCR